MLPPLARMRPILRLGELARYVVQKMVTVTSSNQFPMVESETGRHLFGGRAIHSGSTPPGTDVAFHRLLTIDLTDENCPFQSESLSTLPLYHPIKYGFGGPLLQYEVTSDDAIRIIYFSDPIPDSPDNQQILVESLPEIRFELERPLLDDEDIDWFTITLGGTGTLGHKSDDCQNPECKMFKLPPDVDVIASVPPIPITGVDDVWYEFDGAYMLFYFWQCRGCQTIITSNRAT